MALLAVSCQKAAVGGAQEPEEAPVPIQLTTNLKVNSVSVTKAGVDAWKEEHKLYFYAIPTSTSESQDILVNNQVASAPTGSNTSIELKNADNTYYFYHPGKSTYDFYGYFVDKAAGDDAPQPVIENGVIVLKNITLDGSEDIMLAKADKEMDVIDASGNLLTAPANAYSAYSARLGVVPNLVFQHQLARFVFNVIAGNEDGAKVQIKEVALKSDSKADLYIMSNNEDSQPRGIKSLGSSIDFKLSRTDDHPIPCFPFRVIPESWNSQFEDSDRIGESIMVIPASSHEMKMTLHQTENKTGEEDDLLGEEFFITKTLVPGMVTDAEGNKIATEFLPGYQYNVNVVVYGRQKVLVNVTLSEWNEVGGIKIDNNEDWGDEPKLGLKATNQATQDVCYLYFYDDTIKIADGTTPGTEVKVWDPANNKMVPADEGTYKFDTAVQGMLYVTLAQAGSGESLKTVVTGLSADDPTTPTT